MLGLSLALAPGNPVLRAPGGVGAGVNNLVQESSTGDGVDNILLESGAPDVLRLEA